METVISCTKAKDWVKDGKSIPIYSIGLSDGRGGQSFGKEIPVGTKVEDLIITDKGQYGLDFKLKPSGGGGGWSGGKKSGNESFALSYAKDLVVAGKVDVKNILPIADKLYDWLESKKPASAPVVLASQLPNKPQPQSDDLPF